MKRLKLISLFHIIFFLAFFSISSFADVSSSDITAPSAILIDADTGDILFEKNAHDIMYPASTTKIMTAILTLENTELNDKVVIDKDTPFTDGNRIYVIEGEVFTIEQLLYALMVESANDAAVALAKHIAGSVEEFSKLMNQRAGELGALNTNFVNPNGLPNEEHVSTAYDLAMIAKHAMTLPKFRELAKTVRYQIPPTNKQVETRYLKTSNRLLWGVGSRNKILYRGKWIEIKYDVIEGIKTGYTLQAQQCLVSTASKNNHRFISVVLKAQGTNIYTDTRTLIDYGLEDFKFVKIVDQTKKITTVEVINGEEKQVDLVTEKQLYKVLPRDFQMKPLESVLEVNETINAPIEKGELLGKIIYKIDNMVLGEVNLVAEKSISSKDAVTSVYNFSKSLPSKIINLLLILIILFIVWRSIITIIRINRKKKRLLRDNKIERNTIRQITFDKISQYYKKR